MRLEWLYNSPRPGTKVAEWVSRHVQELQTFPLMDESVVLVNAWQEMGPGNWGYKVGQVTMSKKGSEKKLLVPERGSELWKIRNRYASSQRRIAANPGRSKELDANGSKLRSHTFTAMKLLNRGGEELRLHIKQETIGFVAVILKPDVNGAGFIIIGQSEESSEEIDARILGRDKSEFDPNRPVWTLPLQNPDLAIQHLFNPPFLWHGSSRVRFFTSICALFGFDETTERISKASGTQISFLGNYSVFPSKLSS